jgi:hypothetical protein
MDAPKTSNLRRPALRLLATLLLLAATGCPGEELTLEDTLDLSDAVDAQRAPPDTAPVTDVTGAPGDARAPADATGAPDLADPVDLPPPEADLPSDPCALLICLKHAHCEAGICVCDDGFVSDGQGGCEEAPPPCAEGSCGDKAWCDTIQQACVCKPGFDAVGADCVSPPLTPPASRTLEEVCARYAQEVVLTASEQYTGGDAAQCVAGAPTRAALNDALRRLNLYRWLAGLEPAWDLEATNAAEQECALMQELNALPLNHHPPEDWQCYTAAGAGAAGASNLAWGVWSIADSVDLYMVDPGVPSLGHRRWCLNPSLGHTGFGFFGQSSCMYSFGGGNGHKPDWVAWPPPGYVPEDLVDGVWSFASSKCSWGDATGVALVVATAEVIPLELESAGGNYGNMPALRILPAQSLVGEVQITLSGLVCSGEVMDLTYVVKQVDCDDL